jgi:hypothetical protein
MAYAITYKDNSLLLLLADNDVDTTRSVTFIGKDFKGYGLYQNQNFVTLLTNSASPNNSRPRNPLTGELWYDTTNQRLNIYDPSYLSNSGWMHAGAASISYQQPGGVALGDFWYDLSSQTLNLYTNAGFVSVPTYPKFQPNGWIQPSSPVLDNTVPIGVGQQVTLLENYGNVVGALSNTSFIASSNDSITTFSLAESAAYPVVQGLNIIGYIQATGGFILNSAPATSTSAGVAGQIAFDTDFIYVCTAENDWKRSALTTF